MDTVEKAHSFSRIGIGTVITFEDREVYPSDRYEVSGRSISNNSAWLLTSSEESSRFVSWSQWYEYGGSIVSGALEFEKAACGAVALAAPADTPNSEQENYDPDAYMAREHVSPNGADTEQNVRTRDEHRDEQCIEHIANLMREKMKFSREVKGRSGWQDTPIDVLSAMLREHVEKGDPVDVANFCMMLAAKRAPISAAARSGEDGGLSRDAISDIVEGMAVSVDVSTGDDDARNRLFGTVGETQYHSGDKHDLILLVVDPEPNFKPANVAALEAKTERRFQHIKRGTEYRLIGRGKVQQNGPSDMAEVVIYQDVNDGSFWVRSPSEFYDGRFKEVFSSRTAPAREGGTP